MTTDVLVNNNMPHLYVYHCWNVNKEPADCVCIHTGYGQMKVLSVSSSVFKYKTSRLVYELMESTYSMVKPIHGHCYDDLSNNCIPWWD